MDPAKKSLELLKMDLVEVRAMLAYVESCVDKVAARVSSDGPEDYAGEIERLSRSLGDAQRCITASQERLKAQTDAAGEPT